MLFRFDVIELYVVASCLSISLSVDKILTDVWCLSISLSVIKSSLMGVLSFMVVLVVKLGFKLDRTSNLGLY